MTDLKVRQVVDQRDLERFIRFPHELYAHDPNWVPPLDSDLRQVLNPDRNPFFQHAARDLFLAASGARIVGRIAAITDRNYIAYHQEPTGFFGFFEVIDDYDAAAALFSAARDALRARGITLMRGPANPSLNDEAGLLVQGFDSPPVIKMTYNPRYYPEFCERYGMTKAKDLLAYAIRTDTPLPDKLRRVVARLKTRPGLVVRSIRLRRLRDDLRRIKEIYNDAWSRNWDFAPMTEEEIDELGSRLRPLVVPEIVPIIEINGEPAGMSIALPDYNQLLRTMRGKLNLFKFLFGRHRIDAVRLWALGVKAKFRKLGLDALLYYETFQGAIKKGFRWGEVSWVLEDNLDIIRPIRLFQPEPYKRYRIYQMAV